MSTQERSDLIESRADMVKTLLNMLLIAMESDDPPADEAVKKTIWAATELLNIH